MRLWNLAVPDFSHLAYLTFLTYVSTWVNQSHSLRETLCGGSKATTGQ